MSLFLYRWLGFLLVILLFSHGTAFSHNVSFQERLNIKLRNQNTLKATCHILKEDFYIRFCQGHYVDDIKIKYRDRLVPSKALFTIFRAERDPNRYMVAFDIPKLSHCSQLKLLSTNTMLCLSPRYRLIQMDWSHVHCFPFNVQYVDDTIKACLRLMNTNRHGEMEKNTYSALIYSPDFFKENSACTTGQKINLIGFFSVALILVMPT